MQEQYEGVILNKPPLGPHKLYIQWYSLKGGLHLLLTKTSEYEIRFMKTSTLFCYGNPLYTVVSLDFT